MINLNNNYSKVIVNLYYNNLNKVSAFFNSSQNKKKSKLNLNK